MKAWLTAAFLLASAAAFARPEAGRDYLPIDPPLLQQGKKIELIEFFYYGCPQCLDLEPFLKSWLKSRPNVELVRVPAFRTAWLPLARTYYALAFLGQERRLRDRLFFAIQSQGVDLNEESVLYDWIGKAGVDSAEFKSVYHSRLVESKIMESEDLARRCGITGVPSLVVDGRYLVLGDLSNGELLDELISMARKLRK